MDWTNVAYLVLGAALGWPLALLQQHRAGTESLVRTFICECSNKECEADVRQTVAQVTEA